MDLQELLEKYHELKTENRKLKERIKQLESQCGKKTGDKNNEDEKCIAKKQSNKPDVPAEDIKTKTIDKQSPPVEKINLFKSLFRGREDVFATRWENSKKGTSGYSPACGNEWVSGICQKPKIKCSACKNKDYLELTNQVVENHLRGKTVAGIYPLLPDETCWFLAIDFDGKEWQKDIITIRKACSEFFIPVAVERSRSGNGAHAWFFFEQPVPASTARRFGSALLTFSMNRRHEITFKSYDRLFPNQDTMPKGGFGNLIALPLQKVARKKSNSVFIDDDFQPFNDQWAFLSSMKKLSTEKIESLTSELCQGNDLGILKRDDEENEKPWEPHKKMILKNEFPDPVEIVKANMLFILKTGFSQFRHLVLNRFLKMFQQNMYMA